MQILQIGFFDATMHNVALSDGSVATVPIFYVKEMLLLFLNDPAQMRRYLFFLPTMTHSLVNKQYRIHLCMKFTQEPYGVLHARNIVAMTPMPFHLRSCAFRMKCTQIYKGC